MILANKIPRNRNSIPTIRTNLRWMHFIFSYFTVNIIYFNTLSSFMEKELKNVQEISSIFQWLWQKSKLSEFHQHNIFSRFHWNMFSSVDQTSIFMPAARDSAIFLWEFCSDFDCFVIMIESIFQNRIVPNNGKLILCQPKSVFMDWNQFFRFTLCGANFADTKWKSEHNRRYFSFKR